MSSLCLRVFIRTLAWRSCFLAKWWKALTSCFFQIFVFWCEQNVRCLWCCPDVSLCCTRWYWSANIIANHPTTSLPCLSEAVWPFWDPLCSLTSLWKQNRKKKKEKTHLAKRILYLCERDRWEFGCGWPQKKFLSGLFTEAHGTWWSFFFCLF